MAAGKWESRQRWGAIELRAAGRVSICRGATGGPVNVVMGEQLFLFDLITGRPAE
jgi:hypothetical protein